MGLAGIVLWPSIATPYSSLLPVVMINTNQKQLRGGEGRAYLACTSMPQSLREVRAGTETEAVEEHCLMVCSLA